MTTGILCGGTVAELLERGEAFLAARGVPEPRANAEFLLSAALGRGRGDLSAHPELRPGQERGGLFERYLKERARRIPLAYILGSQPFLGLDIRVTPSVLIPRPETEELVEQVCRLAAERMPAGPLHVLEVGTGSGCVSIALAKALPRAALYATDISAPALELARENARRHGLEGRIRFLREDFFSPGIKGAWADLLVSNPPYIPTAELERLEPEVRREPFLALDGGRDGLSAIRAIAAAASGLLKPGGWLALEIGDGQGRALSRVLSRFEEVEIRRDLSGRERFALARRPGKPKC